MKCRQDTLPPLSSKIKADTNRFCNEENRRILPDGNAFATVTVNVTLWSPNWFTLFFFLFSLAITWFMNGKSRVHEAGIIKSVFTISGFLGGLRWNLRSLPAIVIVLVACLWISRFPLLATPLLIAIRSLQVCGFRVNSTPNRDKLQILSELRDQSNSTSWVHRLWSLAIFLPRSPDLLSPASEALYIQSFIHSVAIICCQVNQLNNTHA